MEPAYDRAADAWPYRTMSPERYAALHAHRLGHLGLEEWTHRPEVYEWLLAVDAICRDEVRLAECRAAYLSSEERRQVDAELGPPRVLHEQTPPKGCGERRERREER